MSLMNCGLDLKILSAKEVIVWILQCLTVSTFKKDAISVTATLGWTLMPPKYVDKKGDKTPKVEKKIRADESMINNRSPRS